MKETSLIANSKVDKPTHKLIIIRTMEKANKPLSSFGISERCELSYYQVEKRMSELERENLIGCVGPNIDKDGSLRGQYILV